MASSLAVGVTVNERDVVAGPYRLDIRPSLMATLPTFVLFLFIQKEMIYAAIGSGRKS
jgi:hypothetical protein